MISVCLTTYNGEKHIKSQLDSILCQLKSDDEIIISDDGSTDSTLSIIERLNDSRIKIFNHLKDNKYPNYSFYKITKNFENALIHAKGEIIFLADQDDIWNKSKVEKCINELNDKLLLIHDCQVIDKDENILIDSYFSHNNSQIGIISNFKNSSYLGCCMAFRKDLLNKALPFPKEPVPHDLWLGFIAEWNKSVVKFDECLIFYRRHSENNSSSSEKSNWTIGYRLKYRIIIAIAFFKRISRKD